MGRPVFARKRSWPPSADSSSQILSVRVSCQTIALYTGSPVLRSQTTVVSRWLVIPSPAMSSAFPPTFSSAPSITCWARCQISLGSCSTQPALGKICSCSSCSIAATWPPWSKIMQRELVVP